MYKAGYENIVNVDYSDVVIENMRETYGKSLSKMSWEVMDITDMSKFDSKSFDSIIEKCTIDSLMVEQKDLWKVDGKMAATIHTVVEGVSKYVLINLWN